MPELNGIEMLKKIKKINNAVKVVIITAYKDAEKIVQAFHLGATDCLFKPFDLNFLKSLLEKHLSQQNTN